MKPKVRRRTTVRQKEAKRTSSSVRPRDDQSRNYAYAFSGVLAAGVVIRILAFAYLGYFNNDNHVAVLEYVSRYWRAPDAAQLNQAYHPPLYYFLAAPLLRAANLPAVQGLSLLLSIATLAVSALLLKRLPWISEKWQPWCLALAAFHPQFILFSLFISNDTLAIFLGAVVFYQCWRLQKVFSNLNVAMLGIFLGLGLLTKSVFLVFILPLALFIWLTARRLGEGGILARPAMFLLIAAVIGSYKYVENFLLFGNPTVNNLDFATWTAEQRPTWIGVKSLFDFNVVKLVLDPVVSSSTVHSYPLMIYGSFWYSLVPESTFHSNLLEPLNRLGSLIYLAALWPTALMAIGAGRIGTAAIGALRDLPKNFSSSARAIFEATLLTVLVLNLFLIIWVGWTYDVWSVFQGRLLFPAYFGVLIALHTGMEWAEPSRLKTRLTRISLLTLLALFIAYFAVEFWLASVSPVNPLRMDHMPYKIDMSR